MVEEGFGGVEGRVPRLDGVGLLVGGEAVVDGERLDQSFGASVVHVNEGAGSRGVAEGDDGLV